MPSEGQIRKAFEVALAAAITTAYGAGSADPTNAACMVLWPNMKTDMASKRIWLRPKMHGYHEFPRTLGQTPSVERRGFYGIQCHLELGVRADPLDALVETLKAAFPYTDGISAGGAVIQIEDIDISDLVETTIDAVKTVDFHWRVHI